MALVSYDEVVHAAKRLRSEQNAEAVPSRLKQAVKDARVKFKDLAAAAGLEPPQVSHFVSGSKGLDTPNMLALLSAATSMGIDIVYVLTGERDDQSARFLQIVSDAVKTVQGQRIPELSGAAAAAGNKGALPARGGNGEALKQGLDRRRQRSARE